MTKPIDRGPVARAALLKQKRFYEKRLRSKKAGSIHEVERDRRELTKILALLLPFEVPKPAVEPKKAARLRPASELSDDQIYARLMELAPDRYGPQGRLTPEPIDPDRRGC